MSTENTPIATREEVEHLKANWLNDPCYDLVTDICESDEYPQFLPYKAELQAFQDDQDRIWKQNREQADQNAAKSMGMPLATYQEWQSLNSRMVNCKSGAIRTLTYYFGLAMGNLSSDNRAELSDFVDLLLEAATFKAKAELIKEQAAANPVKPLPPVFLDWAATTIPFNRYVPFMYLLESYHAHIHKHMSPGALMRRLERWCEEMGCVLNPESIQTSQRRIIYKGYHWRKVEHGIEAFGEGKAIEYIYIQVPGHELTPFNPMP